MIRLIPGDIVKARIDTGVGEMSGSAMFVRYVDETTDKKLFSKRSQLAYPPEEYIVVKRDDGRPGASPENYWYVHPSVIDVRPRRTIFEDIKDKWVKGKHTHGE